MAVDTTTPGADAGGEEAEWLRPGARAILCNLAKFPKFNGQVVEVAHWNEEKKRWKCLLPKGGDVVVFPANLEPAEMQARRVEEVMAMIDEGRLYEAWQATQTKASVPPELTSALDAKLAGGTYSEIVGGRLEVVRTPEKGRGYRATGPIRQGDVLLFDTAVGSVRIPSGPQDAAPNMMGYKDPYMAMANQIRTESKDEEWFQRHVMSLTFVSGGEGHGELVRILANNTMECAREPGRIALFPAAALFNHSCCPNAFADSTRTTCVVRALCDIEAGEEVCLSYITVADGVTKRREMLDSYNFKCACKRCVEEAKSEPELRIPCGCGKWTFSIQGGSQMFQTCTNCYTTFDRDESLHNLSKAKEANAKHYRDMSAGADPHGEVIKLSKLESLQRAGAANGIPPLHKESTFLLNHLANLHYHLAVNVKGEHAAKSLEAFHRYKRLTLERFEERHGSWTSQRDHGYFEILEMLLGAPGLTEESKQLYMQKLASACTTCYGQPFLPPQLSKLKK